jgi:hypothetical protein
MAPYQPRLDWQMWFAALGNFQHNPWILHLGVKLLKGEKTVLDLLENPPRRRPTLIRADSYVYTFSSGNSSTEDWWARSEQSKIEYLPVLELSNPQLRQVMKQLGWERSMSKTKFAIHPLTELIMNPIRSFFESCALKHPHQSAPLLTATLWTLSYFTGQGIMFYKRKIVSKVKQE